MKEKIVSAIKIVFGYGIMIALLVGGLTFFGYMAALVIGGDTAAAICTFIYKKLYPVLVVISTVTIALGILKMYICGESAFSKEKEKKKE